jgi:hypothetical protein
MEGFDCYLLKHHTISCEITCKLNPSAKVCYATVVKAKKKKKVFPAIAYRCSFDTLRLPKSVLYICYTRPALVPLHALSMRQS